MRVHFFFNDTATTEIYTLSLHDALPIFGGGLQLSTSQAFQVNRAGLERADLQQKALGRQARIVNMSELRSEEHTSELQSQSNLVCRLLLEKKKNRDRHTVRVEVSISVQS